ncbi:dihydrofolate reductase family protein [Amycolatopsis coloradensis]|uniref:Dihydrofolate reductase family protein n=1 Tax=Amycolatopsis coloradensis TaxID=76021 RepID=A0ACD5B785_9PSEU
MRSLLDAGLVDEIRLMVCPVTRGEGTRVFQDRRELKPIEVTAFENGVVLLRYAVEN